MKKEKRQLFKAADGRGGFKSQKDVFPYCNYFNLSGKGSKALETIRKELVKIIKDSNFGSATSIKTSLLSLLVQQDNKDK